MGNWSFGLACLASYLGPPILVVARCANCVLGCHFGPACAHEDVVRHGTYQGFPWPSGGLGQVCDLEPTYSGTWASLRPSRLHLAQRVADDR